MNEDIDLMDYIPITSRGLYEFCICPSCKIHMKNEYNTPCMLLRCPVCKRPMIGDLT